VWEEDQKSNSTCDAEKEIKIRMLIINKGINKKIVSHIKARD
jgi:hypothetical protein